LINETKWLHVLEGTPRSGKKFFVKYLTLYFQTQGKNVLLTTTTRVVALRLSQHACTIHIQFRIHVRGYLYILSQPSNIFVNIIPLTMTSKRFCQLHLLQTFMNHSFRSFFEPNFLTISINYSFRIIIFESKYGFFLWTFEKVEF